jgi:hypothetical protein
MIIRPLIETHFGISMANPKVVNLDALIQRSDLNVPKKATPTSDMIYEGFKNGQDYDAVKTAIFSNKDFKKYLTQDAPADDAGGKISSDAKAAVNMRSELDNAPECHECHARVHLLATNKAHSTAKEDGGSAHSDNLKPKHPFCNTGVEERRRAKAKKEAEAKPDAQ